MRNIRWSGVCTVLLSLSLVAVGQISQSDESQQVNLNGGTEHVYKRVGGKDLKLWVFSPRDMKGSDQRPGIVFFSGGGWRNQNPEQFAPQARYLASKGMIAVVADYRVSRVDNSGAYNGVTDAKSAIRWLREHAGELHIKRKALAAGGASAGGHLALSAAVLDGFDEPGEDQKVSSRPDALVLFNPPPKTFPDPEDVLTPQLKQIAAWLGPRARDISPIHHLAKNLPPTIIFHGKNDSLVPYAAVEAFCKKANDLDNRCTLVGYDGADHGFFNPGPNMKWYYETLSEAEKFLRSVGYIRH
jgi:acetyl esterase/lipase